MATQSYGMNVKRMKRLLKVAEKINPREFDMSMWFSTDTRDGDVLAARIAQLAKVPEAKARRFFCDIEKVGGALPNGTLCGTRACLAGWASMDRSLHRQGLRLALKLDQYDGLLGRIGFDGKHDRAALRHFFGLNTEAVAFLFGLTWDNNGHEGAAGKRQMIRHIKDAIAHPEKYGAAGKFPA